jgi:hypothetical protein
MLTSIKEISNHPVVILLYKAGSSGEFLSYALTQSINQFTKMTTLWENNNRCIVQDYFGRTLLFGPVTEDILLPRINLFFEMAKSEGVRHMGLSHHNPHQINFIKNYGATWPVIEITVLHPVSNKFRYRSQGSKISKEYQLIPPNYNPNEKITTALDMGFNPGNHLQIEWSELFLTDIRTTYFKILKFLDCTGDVDYFVDMVDNYVNKNQNLIQSAYEN